jgi:hypothetical protein
MACFAQPTSRSTVQRTWCPIGLFVGNASTMVRLMAGRSSRAPVSAPE